MTPTRINVAPVLPADFLKKKNNGNPITAAMPKHISCRLVNPKITFVFIADRSFGIGTYAICILLSMGVKYALCNTAGFEHCEAKQHSIPYKRYELKHNAAVCIQWHRADQDGVNAYANYNQKGLET